MVKFPTLQLLCLSFFGFTSPFSPASDLVSSHCHKVIMIMIHLFSEDFHEKGNILCVWYKNFSLNFFIKTLTLRAGGEI